MRCCRSLTAATGRRYASSGGRQRRAAMVRVLGVDHVVTSVGDFAKSKAFYTPLMEFLGFEVEAEYDDMTGWSNGKTLFWIAAADAEGKKHKYRKGDIGFHHYACACAAERTSTRYRRF
jgi:catechol 2,3-dioxygenase-like lactoylglutathione lyase family enzyme